MVESKIESLHEDIRDIKQSLKDHIIWEEQKYVNMDDKYAPKITMYLSVGAFLTALGIIVSLII